MKKIGSMFSEREEDEEEEVGKKTKTEGLRKMTSSSREGCEVDSSSSNMISLFLLETDTAKQTVSDCAALKGCEGRENGVNGSRMLLTLLPTQVRPLPSPSCFHWYNYSMRPLFEI